MKFTKKRKRYIRDHYQEQTPKELARNTGVSISVIKKYIKDELESTSSKHHQKKRSVLTLAKEKISSLADIKEFFYVNRAIVAILIIVAFGVYANSLGGDFVSDDIRGYVENPNVLEIASNIENGNMAGVREVLSRRYDFNQLTHGVFYAFFGANEVPLHIFSVLIHAITAVLVFMLISMLFDKRVGLISALIFTVHPLNTEAVAWISARKYLLICLIIVTTSILYVVYKNSQNIKFLIASYLFFAIALFVTRYMWLVVTPCLVILIDQFFIEDRIKPKEWLKSIPIAIPVLLFASLYIWKRYQARVVNLEVIYRFDRAETAPYPMRVVYSIYKAFELYVFPSNLTLYHEGEVLSKWYFGFMVLVVIAILLSVFYFWKKNRTVAGLLLFILVAMAPTLSPTQIAWLAAERYLYTASIAFCVLTAILLIYIEKRSKINNLTVFILVTLLVALSVRTIYRNNDWKTRQSVWESTQRVSPNSPRVYNNLGDVYGELGDHQLAIRMFQTAISLDPAYPEATHNLGNAYARSGDFENAKLSFRKAIELKPDQYQSFHMLGVIALEEGEFDYAIELFTQSLNMNPAYYPAQQGLEFARSGKIEKQLQGGQ